MEPSIDMALAALSDSPEVLRPKAAYYLNLDSVPIRRWHMEQQLRVTRLPAKRFSAVDAKRVAAGDFNEEYVHRQGLDESTLKKSSRIANATVACFLSHVEALKQLQRELKPHEIGLVMEDDVVIPTNWAAQIEGVVRNAPRGWQLLKVSGWGSSREKDLVKEPTMWSKLKSWFVAAWSEDVPEVKYYDMKGPFRDPLQPMRYFYAGSAGYLVRGFAIPFILKHLQSRPIKDYDSMLLSDTTIRFYEEWPHVFEISKDAFGIHSDERTEKEDEKSWDNLAADVVDRKRKTGRHGQAHLEPEVPSEQETKSPAAHQLPKQSSDGQMFLKVHSKGYLKKESIPGAIHDGVAPSEAEAPSREHTSWLKEQTVNGEPRNRVVSVNLDDVLEAQDVLSLREVPSKWSWLWNASLYAGAVFVVGALAAAFAAGLHRTEEKPKEIDRRVKLQAEWCQFTK